MKKREEFGGRHSGINCFSSKIICGDCGSFYGSKILHSTSKYKRYVWQCNNKFRGDKKCETPPLYENNIKTSFVYCFNKLLSNRESVKDDCIDMINLLKDTSVMEKELDALTWESQEIYSKITELVNENAEIALNQDIYDRKYSSYRNEYEKIKSHISEIEKEKESRTRRLREIEIYLNEIASRTEIVTEFDETLWHTTIEKVTVKYDGSLIFTFKDGQEIKV